MEPHRQIPKTIVQVHRPPKNIPNQKLRKVLVNLWYHGVNEILDLQKIQTDGLGLEMELNKKCTLM